MRALDLPETEAPHLGVSSGGVEVEGTVSCVLALPETEAPHLGVSSGGVEVDGTVSCVLALPEMEAPHLGVSSGGWKWMVGLPKLPETVAQKSIE